MLYALGILCGILAGCFVFFGQVLQKKVINDLKKVKDNISIFDLIKKPLWLIGLFCMLIFTTTFVSIAQILIGPALIPGLLSAGLIVLAVGSIKILGEKLKKEEYTAIALLILGIVLISLSKLTIEGNLDIYREKPFLLRISIVATILFLFWFGLYYGGLKSKKKALFMSLGAGFPFVIANICMQPLILSIEMILKNKIDTFILLLFFITAFIVIFTNVLGTIHLQKALAEGNASIIIPVQQIPQQLSIILIYFVIFAMAAPNIMSYIYISLGIIIIIVAGFILSKRQSTIKNIQ